MGQCALALPAQIPEGSYKYMEVKQIGNIMPGTNRDNPNQGRVYDSKGLSPTISSMQGGRQPMTVDIKQATKEGFIPCEVGGYAI